MQLNEYSSTKTLFKEFLESSTLQYFASTRGRYSYDISQHSSKSPWWRLIHNTYFWSYLSEIAVTSEKNVTTHSSEASIQLHIITLAASIGRANAWYRLFFYLSVTLSGLSYVNAVNQVQYNLYSRRFSRGQHMASVYQGTRVGRDLFAVAQKRYSIRTEPLTVSWRAFPSCVAAAAWTGAWVWAAAPAAGADNAPAPRSVLWMPTSPCRPASDGTDSSLPPGRWLSVSALAASTARHNTVNSLTVHTPATSAIHTSVINVHCCTGLEFSRLGSWSLLKSQS